jgi:hypothetical protein
MTRAGSRAANAGTASTVPASKAVVMQSTAVARIFSAPVRVLRIVLPDHGRVGPQLRPVPRSLGERVGQGARRECGRRPASWRRRSRLTSHPSKC